MYKKQLRDIIRDRPELLNRLSDPKAAAMLRRHYIDNIEWFKVASEFSYSTDNVLVIRRKAAVELQHIIESEV